VSVRPAAFAGAATSKTLTAGGQKLTELKLSPATQKLARALDDNKDTGDAGDVRAYKADPKMLAKLSASQLEKVVKLAVAARSRASRSSTSRRARSASSTTPSFPDARFSRGSGARRRCGIVS
jgi:hypothetical protein